MSGSCQEQEIGTLIWFAFLSVSHSLSLTLTNEKDITAREMSVDQDENSISVNTDPLDICTHMNTHHFFFDFVELKSSRKRSNLKCYG